MSEDARFIRSLRLRNLLSFGPDSGPIELGALNVLIGPNGSGKSNVIEAVDFLRASATDLFSPVRKGGGIVEWLWKGTQEIPVAEIEAAIDYPRPTPVDNSNEHGTLRHRIKFSRNVFGVELVEEVIEDDQLETNVDGEAQSYYSYQAGRPVLGTRSMKDGKGSSHNGRGRRESRIVEDFRPNKSILSQRFDPIQYPEITFLRGCYIAIRLYGNWDLGGISGPRQPQSADLQNDCLAEDASNLGLVLSRLSHTGDVKDKIVSQLTQFYHEFRDFSVLVQGGTVQIFFREEGLHDPVPATRLSDGSLRFLCLATILCHPFGTPLICIEEPESGLHPDILPTVAEMLVEASQRTQIIVTTHSDILVDALSHIPESVLVCEKESNSTLVRRLDQERLRDWLKEYSLGDLWRSGELGGNRW